MHPAVVAPLRPLCPTQSTLLLVLLHHASLPAGLGRKPGKYSRCGEEGGRKEGKGRAVGLKCEGGTVIWKVRRTGNNRPGQRADVLNVV